MKVDIFAARWAVDGEGTWLSVKVPSIHQAQGIVNGIDTNKCYTVEITEKKKKRSLNANAYMWQLCQKLAEVNGITKEEVYRQAIKDVGIFQDFALDENAAKTLRKAWEMLGTGWITEQVDYAEDGDRLVIRCYYGSSKYNTKQMSRLIDYIVQDCKACEIETLTPAEISLLKEGWQAE